jgi:hypothetical protein
MKVLGSHRVEKTSEHANTAAPSTAGWTTPRAADSPAQPGSGPTDPRPSRLVKPTKSLRFEDARARARPLSGYLQSDEREEHDLGQPVQATQVTRSL